jgi:hypothetical protein
MKEITYEEYKNSIIVAYRYLNEKYGGYIDIEILQRENAEINLFSALAHPYLYLEKEINH